MLSDLYISCIIVAVTQQSILYIIRFLLEIRETKIFEQTMAMFLHI